MNEEAARELELWLRSNFRNYGLWIETEKDDRREDEWKVTIR